MDPVQRTLERLRFWFFVWFVGQAAVGIVTAAWVLDGLGGHAFLRQAVGGTFDTAFTVGAGAIVSLVLLLLGAALLAALLERAPWARVVMLALGWITVVPGAVSLLASPLSSAFVEPAAALSGVDGWVLQAVNVVTTGADLVYWSWAIYVLQFTPAVRAAFVACSGAGSDMAAAVGRRR